MSLDEVLAEADAAERASQQRLKEQKAAREARAVHRSENAINAAHNALKALNNDGFPDLETLARVLSVIDETHHILPPVFRRRAWRAAAHILCESATRIARDYGGPRPSTSLPDIASPSQLPTIPVGSTDDDEL